MSDAGGSESDAGFCLGRGMIVVSYVYKMMWTVRSMSVLVKMRYQENGLTSSGVDSECFFNCGKGGNNAYS